jgi:hypothetical protein
MRCNEGAETRRLFNVLPSIACFLCACWYHHSHTGDWLFMMLASLFLLEYYRYMDPGVGA